MPAQTESSTPTYLIDRSTVHDRTENSKAVRVQMRKQPHVLQKHVKWTCLASGAGELQQDWHTKLLAAGGVQPRPHVSGYVRDESGVSGGCCVERFANVKRRCVDVTHEIPRVLVCHDTLRHNINSRVIAEGASDNK